VLLVGLFVARFGVLWRLQGRETKSHMPKWGKTGNEKNAFKNHQGQWFSTTFNAKHMYSGSGFGLIAILELTT